MGHWISLSGAFAEAKLSGEPGARKPHVVMLRQAQYRSVRGRLGNWQPCRNASKDRNPISREESLNQGEEDCEEFKA